MSEKISSRLSKNGNIRWYNLRNLEIEGKGWEKTRAFYDRFPAKAESVVTENVWNLSRHSAGICARFVTTASTFHARWTLTGDALAMDHMPATGVSGLDLYVKDSKSRWRWLAIGRPLKVNNTALLVTGIKPLKREYMLYLPLYNGVKSVEIGVSANHAIYNAPPRPARRAKPIVFYGTSITQGACASRPGMVYTAILGRRLGYPVINLGFSGSAVMEPEIARLLAELDPIAYVLDALPNMTAPLITKRARYFIDTLRNTHPKIPIILVEDRTYGDAHLVQSRMKRNISSRAAVTRVYKSLLKAGDKNLFYVAGEKQIGDDFEATVDGSHPTDLGFMRQADFLEPYLKSIL